MPRNTLRKGLRRGHDWASYELRRGFTRAKYGLCSGIHVDSLGISEVVFYRLRKGYVRALKRLCIRNNTRTINKTFIVSLVVLHRTSMLRCKLKNVSNRLRCFYKYASLPHKNEKTYASLPVLGT